MKMQPNINKNMKSYKIKSIYYRKQIKLNKSN